MTGPLAPEPERGPETVGVDFRALLSDSRDRLIRAQEHLQHISEVARTFGADNADRLKLRIDGMTVTLVGDTPEAPAGLSIRIGEFAYNLRAALDYLVFALALLDSGSPQEQTQFPICDADEKFAKQVGRLRGVAPEHVAMVERLQPYHGNPEIALLRDLNNGDKHRAIQVLSAVGQQRVTIEGPETPEHLIDAPVVLCLPPDIPLMEALPRVQEKVAAIIEQFEPTFLRQMPTG